MKSLTFLAGLLSAAGLLAADELTARREGTQVVIRSGENEILRYQAEPGELPRPDIKKAFIRGGYIQSIRTLSGKLITDDFPADHLHHHGVWSPWTKTEFEGRHPDFWNMGAGTGRVEFVALDKIWQKDGSAGFTARHRFMDMTAKPEKVALLEKWEIRVTLSDNQPVIDFTSTQTCATDSPLKLPEYHYGGFGFRGNWSWNGPPNCKFLSASGITDRIKLNGSREKWCWVGGKVDDETCGITILGHPENFRFPQPVRANPDQPFFCFAPQQLGEMEISPGKEYVARYRLVVAEGEPDAKAAEGWWQAYAKDR
ncbi:MAG: PmoA family protein [Verrucomicrobiota bacterium]